MVSILKHLGYHLDEKGDIWAKKVLTMTIYITVSETKNGHSFGIHSIKGSFDDHYQQRVFAKNSAGVREKLIMAEQNACYMLGVRIGR